MVQVTATLGFTETASAAENHQAERSEGYMLALPTEEFALPRNAAPRSHSSGSPRDEIQFAVAFKIILAARLWRARFTERMKKLDQTDARWTALYMIADASKGLTQTNLAERLGVRGPTLVRLLDALEHQHLIARESASHDRRAKIISISAKGREVLAQVDGIAATLRDELFTGVSDADLQTTDRVLQHLSHRLEPASSE
ncbi:MAG: MarR family transcriptional regulator [Hyphomonadaceae bacterium]|nr:MarR family transcriptional regulator [Hyphomonadaceae bacterium]